MTSGDIHVGNLSGIEGEVNIAGGDIYKGYTAEQVSILLTQITTTLQPKPFDGRCPYKGLEVFEEEDADLFFGRERLVADLLRRVQESRTLFITGPSGSGKSSLVRAGLLHTLKSGALPGSERWLYETLKPGREPIKDLALALSRLKSPELADYFQAHAAERDVLNKCAESVLSGRKDQRLVLFVDQFEEIFTQVNNEPERLAFLEMLAHAGTIDGGRVMVLFAMRSDFVSNCATYPALNDLLSHQFRQIGAMQPDELVSAIALPAKHVGLPIEDELVARIINDMKGEPGALPLMQFALKDLFDAQMAKGGMIALTLEDYLRHGGIHKSLERHADSSFARLDPHEQDLARSIFTGLIEIGRGTSDTRRTALFDELVPADAKPEDVEAIVGKLADARLIITDEQAGKDTVTISHEKLIDAWPWLKKLVNENRDVIALQNEIANDAKEWQEHGRDASYLYRGARLANAREQLEARKLALSGLAHEFIDAGVRAHTGELEAERKRVRRLLYVTAGLALAVLTTIFFAVQARQQSSVASQNAALAEQNAVMALSNLGTAQAASTMAVAQQATAQANAEEAEYQARAAQSMAWRERNLPLSLLLGVEVYGHEDSPQTRGLLLDNVQFNPQLLRYLGGHNDAVQSVAYSPDGTTLASGGADGMILFWDAITYEPVGEPLRTETGAVEALAFSPDGSMLASGSGDGSVTLWDASTREPIGQPLRGHGGAVYAVAFHPDGGLLASASADGLVILWDLNLHEPLASLAGHSGEVLDIAFSPDGRLLASASADRTIVLWDVETRQPAAPPLTGHGGAVYSVAFSPDGTLLASGSNDTTILLWNVNTRSRLEQPLRGHDGRIERLAFSPDGETLASASSDQTILLWDVDTLERRGLALRGHSALIYSLAFSPDGSRLASGGLEGNIIIWDTAREQRIDRPIRPNAGSVNSVAFHPDGTILAAGTFNNTVSLWDVSTLAPVTPPLLGHTAQIRSVAFSPNGSLLASGGDDRSILLWDTTTWQRIGIPVTGHSASVYSVAFSPDGKTLASGGIDGTVMLWDVETHEPLGAPLAKHTDAVYAVAFSPAGELVASGGAEGTIILWDVETHEPRGPLLAGHTGLVRALAFSPDGKILASGSGDDTVILWDVETSQPIGEPLRDAARLISSVAFSPDGKILAAGVYDKTIMLWDVGTRELIGQPLVGHQGSVYSLAFSPDGKTLASGSIDNSLILWDLDPESWAAKSCERAGRNLSRREWTQYFRSQAYHQTCEQWPPE